MRERIVSSGVLYVVLAVAVIGVIAAVKIGGWEDQPFPWVADEQTTPAPRQPTAPHAPRFSNCSWAQSRWDGIMRDLAAGVDVSFSEVEDARQDVEYYCHTPSGYPLPWPVGE